MGVDLGHSDCIGLTFISGMHLDDQLLLSVSGGDIYLLLAN